MANLKWPDLVSDGSPRVERLDKNIVQESLGGQEFAISLWPSPRYRYSFSYKLRTTVQAPPPYGAMSELVAVLWLVQQAKGALGRFDVTDPTTGNIIACRLEKDSLVVQQEEGCPWYSCEIAFISVL